jgi:hypothetical protein
MTKIFSFKQVYDTVIALHPNYSLCYAPGVILKIANNLSVLIRFYDGFESIINKEDVYKIPLVKFEYDCDNIMNLERRWIGETIVSRNPFTYVYELGKVKERIGNGRQYAIEWSQEGKISIQSSNHIFGRYTHKQPIVVNDYVLAATKHNIYLPGRVIGSKGEYFRVKFVDGAMYVLIASISKNNSF